MREVSSHAWYDKRFERISMVESELARKMDRCAYKISSAAIFELKSVASCVEMFHPL